jgi:phospholipid-binding lipoprotein MlaA
MQSHRPRYRLLLASAWALALAAGPAFAQNDEVADPFEPVNRKMYAINQAVDHCCLGPAARAYGRYVPKPIRKGIHNFNQNLGEPLVFVNDVLQGHPHAAARTFGRFVINTTWGLVGVIDVAKKGDIPPHDNGFGTTLGKWGAQPGPYLFLPVLGPSTVRDGFGSIVNIFLSPQYYADYPGDNVIGPLTLVADGLNTRWRAQRELDTVQQTSTDPYATLRSYYLQSREARIHGAATTELPDFDTPDATGAPAAPGAPKTTTAPALPDIESEPEPPAAPDAAAPPAPPARADAAPAPVPEAPAAPPAPPAPDR